MAFLTVRPIVIVEVSRAVFVFGAPTAFFASFIPFGDLELAIPFRTGRPTVFLTMSPVP
jgi:hypothetical protein